MTRVRIEPSGSTLEVAPGERLLDAHDEQAGSALRLGCRGAHCGTCLVRVEVGAGAVAAPLADELRTLASLLAPAGARLGCQIVIAAHAELVVLRVVESDA